MQAEKTVSLTALPVDKLREKVWVMLSDREFNGWLIKWIVTIGAVILFHGLIIDSIDGSIDGFSLFIEYCDLFVEWFDG